MNLVTLQVEWLILRRQIFSSNKQQNLSSNWLDNVELAIH